jgi:hypothetical protein
MAEPLGPALAIGLASIAGLVGFAVLATRRERRGRAGFVRKPDAVAGPLPILRIPRAAGESALRSHQLDARERVVFEAMDAAIQRLPHAGNAADDFAANCDCVAAIGAAHGLDRDQSIAFWVRATFSRFEPAGGRA